MQNVQILNQSTLMAAAALTPILAALQKQLDDDFGPAYQIQAKLLYPSADDGVSWPIYLVDTEADAPPGALAWHSVDDRSRPYGIIPLKTVLDDNADPAPTIGHELLEMLADPKCSKVAVAHYPLSQRLHRTAEIAYEVCDPCENDAYSINGLAMTNFILPNWFHNGGAAPFDFLGRLPGPLTIDAGGYMQWSSDGRHWHQVMDRHAIPTRKANPGYHSRACRRARVRAEADSRGHHARILQIEQAVRAKHDPSLLAELLHALAANPTDMPAAVANNWCKAA